MKTTLLSASVLAIALLAGTDAHAIDAKYREKLERSGCTQMSEMQGCDINKTKAENAKAGFGTAPATSDHPGGGPSPYAGHWRATNGDQAVATITIDRNEHVTVNGSKVKAVRSDAALVFSVGTITYTIQGDRRLKGEGTWRDSDAGTSGPIAKGSHQDSSIGCAGQDHCERTIEAGT